METEIFRSSATMALLLSTFQNHKKAMSNGTDP